MIGRRTLALRFGSVRSRPCKHVNKPFARVAGATADHFASELEVLWRFAAEG
jgi:hypothetical protein